MNFFKYLVCFLFLWLFALPGKAQVNAPDFVCVKSDSLLWNLPSNTCGSFNAYQIFFSPSFDGPYSLLATITDPAQTIYYHSNPSSQQWFYYLQSDFNCPGQSVLQSDTLDNRSPAISAIQRVSVEAQRVVIDWSLSSSPEVFAYVIYRTTPLGTLPIDTVYGAVSSYIDLTATPNDKIESYYVLAIDECGNSSLFFVPHFTMLLSATSDPCLQSITIRWNRYQNWPDGIGQQEIWVGIDGAPAQVVASLPGTDSTYTIQNVQKNLEYCIFVRAFQEGRGIFSNSNQLCIRPPIIQPITDLYLKNVSVNPGNDVKIDWLWNTNAEIKLLEFFSAAQNSDYATVSLVTPFNPLQANNSFSEPNTTPDLGRVFYRLQTTDLCDSLVISNFASTIFLSGSAQDDLTNRLTWTPYEVEGGLIQSYDLYRIVDGIESLAANIDATEVAYTDPVNAEIPEEAFVCYYIVANAFFTLPSGEVEQVKSRSNIHCVQQLSNIFVPNAFAPAGINNQFKPVIVFSESVDYKMTILDRWGGLLFETTDINEGWSGRKGFHELPMGAYPYIIRLVQPDGRVVEKRGIVILIR